jgi:uncharacterized protein (TIGR03382 family)
VLISGAAWGAVADWRVNEVFPGTGAVRFVELYAPPSAEIDNCLFPTTRLELYDPFGSLLGAVAPFETTVCFPGNTYLLFATPEAQSTFGVVADAPLPVPIPAAAGQVCLASSQTRYDCARWGNIVEPIRYFRNVSDESSAPSIEPGTSLARRGDTSMIAADFVLLAATPRQPNDGTVIPAPDAGPPPPDAAPAPDAAPFPDASPFAPGDARTFPAPPDAAPIPAFLTARPGGGGCQTAGADAPSLAAWITLALLLWRRNGTARRRAAPPP